jgi:hypothetical protein
MVRAQKRYVIRCEGLVGSIASEILRRTPKLKDDLIGTYLKSFDLEAHGGQGFATWTDYIRDALEFDSFFAAMEYWRQTSKVRPLRPDGRPNRPLTAFSVSIQEKGD